MIMVIINVTRVRVTVKMKSNEERMSAQSGAHAHFYCLMPPRYLVSAFVTTVVTMPTLIGLLCSPQTDDRCGLESVHD